MVGRRGACGLRRRVLSLPLCERFPLSALPFSRTNKECLAHIYKLPSLLIVDGDFAF